MSIGAACPTPTCRGSDALCGGLPAFGVLGQIVGDFEPRRFIGDESVCRRAYAWIVIERSQRDTIPVWRSGIARRDRGPRAEFVDDWRSADATKAAEDARGRLIECHRVLTLHPFEIALLNSGSAAKRGTVPLAAHRAMAIAWRHEWAVDLELDAATQAASVQYWHANLPTLTSFGRLQF